MFFQYHLVLLQSIAFEICANVPSMHELEAQLEKLTKDETSTNLTDQQNHLEALWNHLSRRLTEKQRGFKSKCIGMWKNSEFQSRNMADARKVVDKWLKSLRNAVHRLRLMPDVLDLTKGIDISSLKHIFMVCFVNYKDGMNIYNKIFFRV